jgi:hypothetical protein
MSVNRAQDIIDEATSWPGVSAHDHGVACARRLCGGYGNDHCGDPAA